MKRPDARLERLLATLAILVIGLISLANVVVRYLTGGSFAFTEEFSVFLLVVLTFAGASVALRRNGHIRIAMLERALPWAPRRALILFQDDLAGDPVGLALAGTRPAAMVVPGLAAAALGTDAASPGAADPGSPARRARG